MASGQTLGTSQRVILHLLDIEPMLPKLKGLVMELYDCAYPLLAGEWVGWCAPLSFLRLADWAA